jgi:hypothetical protein
MGAIGVNYPVAMRETPAEIDVTVPSIARVYDYYLGGKDNYPADREFADRIAARVPDVPAVLRANRAFLRRVVRALAVEYGIQQFLDIGSGLPTQDNVHQVAQRHTPGACVVYVDNDPIVLAHGRALLTSGDRTAVVDGDLREPEAILANPNVRRLIDFDRPVAVLLLTTLFFVADEHRPNAILARLHDAMAPGSFLAVSHAEVRPLIQEAGDAFTREATEPGIPRTREAITGFFEGFELIAPGLVPVSAWRPDGTEPENSSVWLLGGLGHRL